MIDGVTGAQAKPNGEPEEESLTVPEFFPSSHPPLTFPLQMHPRYVAYSRVCGKESVECGCDGPARSWVCGFAESGGAVWRERQKMLKLYCISSNQEG